MDKPLSVKIQTFQKEISDIIAKSELPIYLLKYLIKDLYLEIDNLANDFSQKEILEYNQSLESAESSSDE